MLKRKKTALLSALMILVPAISLAAEPTAYLERSKVIATGNEIRAYQVPTRNATGKVKYYDITIPLEISDNGKPKARAIVFSVPSPKANVNEFVPGVYSANGIDCTLLTSPFGGRTEAVLNCVDGGITLSAGWYTGPIAGNPFETELLGAGVDTVPGNENYAWGKLGKRGGGDSWWACLRDVGEILAVRQVDDTIIIYNYKDDNISNCQVNLIRNEE